LRNITLWFSLEIKTHIMRYVKFLLFSVFLFSNAKSQHNWSWLTGSDLGPAVSVPAVKAAANGNSYLTAGYFGSVAIGSSTFISQGGTNSFLAMLNPSGNIVWSIPVTGTFTSYFNDIDTDTKGDVYCVGAFQSASVSIGSHTLSGSDGTTLFVCKINSSGQILWLSTGVKGIVYLPQIYVNNSGVFVSGTSGSLTAGSTTVASKGGSDYFIAKYDFAGNLIWLVGNGGTGDEHITDISVLSTGESLICGHFSSPTISFGSFSITGSGIPFSATTFIAKYDNTGTIKWAKSLIALNLNTGKLSADAFGNCYFGGTYSGSLTSIGNFTFTSAGSGGFISKIDTDGNFLWAKNVSALGNTRISDIKSDPVGNVIAFGDFNGAYASVGTQTVINDSSTTSIFLCYLNASGVSLEMETFGGKYHNYSHCLDVASSGELIIAGRTVGRKMELSPLVIDRPKSGMFMFVGKTSSLLTGLSKHRAFETNNYVYPNPCFDQAYLKFDGKIDDIKLYDISGRQISATFEHLQGQVSIRLNNASNGIYLLQVKSELKVYSFKIVKQ